MRKKIALSLALLLTSTVIYYGCKKKDSSSDSNNTATATCSDGIQNQSETGVDCGGPCAACPCVPADYFCPTLTDCLAGTYCVQDNCPTSKSYVSTITASGVSLSIANFGNYGSAIKLGATWSGTGTTSLTIHNQTPWNNDIQQGLVSGAGTVDGTIDTSGTKVKITLNYQIQYGPNAGTCYNAVYTKK